MFRKTRIYLCFVFIVLMLSSCGLEQENSVGNDNNVGESSNQKTESMEKGSWTAQRELLFPDAMGTVVYGSDIVTIDASNANQGYLMIQYLGENPKVKLQILGPDQITYTYNMTNNLDTFPLTSGSGTYSLSVYENVTGTQYALAFSQDIVAEISDEFLPFLYPNQYVWYTKDSNVISVAQKIVYSANTEIDVVELIYDYLIENFKYDYEKASTVETGYIPSIDDSLQQKTGICFDYASVMVAMLRSQGIPTRLEVGYCGEEYHAWISVYTKEKGWLNGVVECVGNDWNLVDPTFASTSDSPKKFTAEIDDYTVKYVY